MYAEIAGSLRDATSSARQLPLPVTGLDLNDMRELVRTHVLTYIDQRAWEMQQRIEDAERESVPELLELLDQKLQ